MTQAEEKIYEKLTEMSNQQSVFNERFYTLQSLVAKHDAHIDQIKADRNKAIGMSWLASALIAIGGFIYQLFIRHQ